MRGNTPGNTWSPPRSLRTLHYSSSMLHIVGVPLIILSSIGVGFMTVILKDVLLPFVIGLFLVYLLRPLVNVLTTPFSYWCSWIHCFTLPPASGVHHLHSSGLLNTNRKQSTSAPGSDGKFLDKRRMGLTATRGGGRSGATGKNASVSPPKYPPHRAGGGRALLSRFSAWVGETWEAWVGGGGISSMPPLGSDQEQCGIGCGRCRITRCPRWVAIILSLVLACTILGALLLMVADAIQRFQHESLNAFVEEAGSLVGKLQRWLAGFGIMLEGSAILEAVKAQINVPFLVKTTVTVVMDGVGNGLLVILLLLYLLAEQSFHQPGSLRARIDDQIQRYIGIKTIISAVQGVLVYLIMGTWLQVRMAHLIAVLHFILNFIPTAGPVIATIVPMPLVILDPSLTVTSRITAFLGPSLVHIIIGNFVEPMVFGQSMELHPVTVLLALALWYSLWGVAGAILAVPITAVIRIVFDAINHPYARIIIAVMEGRLSEAMEDASSALEITGDDGGTTVGDTLRGGGRESIGADCELGDSLPPRGASGSIDNNRDLDEEEEVLLHQQVVLCAGKQHQQRGGGRGERSPSSNSTDGLLGEVDSAGGMVLTGGAAGGGGEHEMQGIGGGDNSGGGGGSSGGGGGGGKGVKDVRDNGGWGFGASWLAGGNGYSNSGSNNSNGAGNSCASGGGNVIISGSTQGGRGTNRGQPSPVHHLLSPSSDSI